MINLSEDGRSPGWDQPGGVWVPFYIITTTLTTLITEKRVNKLIMKGMSRWLSKYVVTVMFPFYRFGSASQWSPGRHFRQTCGSRVTVSTSRPRWKKQAVWWYLVHMLISPRCLPQNCRCVTWLISSLKFSLSIWYLFILLKSSLLFWNLKVLLHVYKHEFSLIWSTPSHPVLLRYILLSSHLCLHLPSYVFPSGFQTNILCAILYLQGRLNKSYILHCCSVFITDKYNVFIQCNACNNRWPLNTCWGAAYQPC